MKYYNIEVCKKLIEKYTNKKGMILTLEESKHGLGTVICYGNGLMTTIIREKHINESNVNYTIRMYMKMPKKYEKWIEKIEIGY